MTNSCKGVCRRSRVVTPITRPRYECGQKFCSICEVFFETESLRCPCCKTKLRTRPRSRRRVNVERIK